MSEEFTTPDPVELARRFVKAWSSGDGEAIESLYAPDAVLAGPELGMFEGAASIRTLFEDFASPYHDSHFEIEEFRDLGNGVLFVVFSITGHPAGSSGELRLRNASVIIVTEGLTGRQTNYKDIDEARAASQRLAESRG
jgi:ketosteroid isomerase-like protein